MLNSSKNHRKSNIAIIFMSMIRLTANCYYLNQNGEVNNAMVEKLQTASLTCLSNAV